MRLTPDALLLGPLALSWPNLALLLGILVFTSLAARRGLESKSWWVLLATLLAARIGYALEHLETWPSLGSALLGIVDIRSGGWNWPWGLVGGVVVAGILLRQQASALLVPALAAVTIALLPLGIQQGLSRPAQPAASQALDQTVLGLLEPGQAQPSKVRFGDLSKPMLVNLWATWCPTCRSQMPLLAEYQQQGHPIVLLNAGEDPATIQTYLQETHISPRIMMDNGLQQAFRVSGLPTTLLIGSNGKILARHMGPVNRAQLEQLLKQLE